MRFLALFFVLIAFAHPCEAAYRIYRLKVTPYDAKGRAKKPRYVLSSLDHIQYESVYGSYRWDRVEIVDHWYCPGDTSYRAACKKPKEKRPREVRGPASYDRPKRIALPRNMQPIIP